MEEHVIYEEPAYKKAISMHKCRKMNLYHVLDLMDIDLLLQYEYELRQKYRHVALLVSSLYGVTAKKLNRWLFG